MTHYIFNGHDFTTNNIAIRRILLDTEEVMINSAWLVYLKYSQPGNTEFPFIFYHVPGRGFGGGSEYRVNHAWRAISLDVQFDIRRQSGPGENYDSIHIIQIESSETVEGTDLAGKVTGNSILPVDLNVTDYFAVLEFFGLDQ